ncbi:MAG: TCR/Tet family MFS transporter [Planctomycetes bacterium]|nr:TCR/Tet family MFS transporter [Planctomycetota bacterium]
MQPRAPGLPFIFVTLVLDVLGFGIIIPVGPHLVQHLQGGAEVEAAPVVGFLAAAYAAMQFLFAPLLGALSDRFGRRPVLLVSMFGSGLDYVAMALVPTVPWLFVTRALNGLSGATITVANAYIADVTPAEKRAAGFAIVGAAFAIGFMLGPLLGGVLGGIDIHLPFYVAGGITLLNWLYGYRVLPESLPPERRKAALQVRWNPLSGIGNLARYPLALRLAGALFLINLAQFGLHAVWVLYTQYRFGWDETAVGYSLCAVGFGAAIVNGTLVRRIVPRLGEPRSLVLGFVIGTLAYVGYGLASQGWMIYLVIAFGSLGGIGMPALQAMVTKTVRADEQGAVQGGLSSVLGLAQVFGPVIGSELFAWSISGEVAGHAPGMVFFVCAGLGVFALGGVAHALKLRGKAG